MGNLVSMDYVRCDFDVHVNWIDNFYANNEDVEFVETLPDDIDIEGMLKVSQVDPNQFEIISFRGDQRTFRKGICLTQRTNFH